VIGCLMALIHPENCHYLPFLGLWSSTSLESPFDWPDQGHVLTLEPITIDEDKVTRVSGPSQHTEFQTTQFSL
jgi:hypothetical protein